MPSTCSRLRIVRSRCSGLHGAMVKPQLPMTTVVTPLLGDGVAKLSQVSCASKCVCRSTIPGASTCPSASTRVCAEPRFLPTATMRPPLIAIPPSIARPPRPSMTWAFSITRSCMLHPYGRLYAWHILARYFHRTAPPFNHTCSMPLTLRVPDAFSLLYSFTPSLLHLGRSATIKKQSGAKGSPGNVQQPGLRDSIGVEHQRDAEPFGRLTLCFLAVPIGGEANYSENDGANNISRTGQGEAERLQILQVVHKVVSARLSVLRLTTAVLLLHSFP